MLEPLLVIWDCSEATSALTVLVNAVIEALRVVPNAAICCCTEPVRVDEPSSKVIADSNADARVAKLDMLVPCEVPCVCNTAISDASDGIPPTSLAATAVAKAE